MTKKHSKYAPSKMKSYELCCGYESKNFVYAASKEGEEMHEYLELIIPPHSMADKIKAKKLYKKFTADQKEWIAQIEEYLKEDVLSGDANTLAPLTVFKEKRISLKPLGIEGFDGGTADLVILDRMAQTAIIRDWKFGFVEVDDPEDNFQLKIYGLGLMLENPWIDSVALEILQPKLDIIGQATITREDIELIKLRIERTIGRVEEYKATPDSRLLSPHVEVCRNCSHFLTCPAVKAFVMSSSAIAGHVEFSDSDLDMKTPKARANIYQLAQLMETWSKEAKGSLLAGHQEGQIVEGYSMRENGGKQEVLVPFEAYDTLTSAGMIDLAEFLSATKVSFSKLTELVKSKAQKGDKVEAEKKLLTLLNDKGILNKSGGYSYLVRDK